MISTKDLTEEQRSAIEQWAREGAQLPEIQRRLKGEHGLNVTYMDTRFLILDLGIEIQSEDGEEADRDSDSTEGAGADTSSDFLDPQKPAAGGVSMTTHDVTQPGAIVSGTVTFSDGEKGIWMIDRTGRPGLEMDKPGYQPSEADMIEMEKQLRELLQGMA